MATPKPVPGPNSDAASKAAAALGIGAGMLDTGTSNLFGAGTAWAGQPVSGAFDLGIPINRTSAGKDAAGNPLPATSKTGPVSVDDLVQAFAGAFNNPTTAGTAATIQQALWLGGFYPASYQPTFGVPNPEDIDAFTKVAKLAAQTGQNVATYLQTVAKIGAQTGAAAAWQHSTPNLNVKIPNPADLAAAADNAYQALTGRKATDAEKQAFAAMYRQMVVSAQQDAQKQIDTQLAKLPPITDLQPATKTVTAQPYDSAFLAKLGPIQRRMFAQANPLGEGRDGSSNVAAQLNPAQAKVDPTFSEQVGNYVTQGQQIAQSAPSTQGTITTDLPSVGTAAQDYVRAHAGAETGAHDIALQVHNFLQLLGGIQ